MKAPLSYSYFANRLYLLDLISGQAITMGVYTVYKIVGWHNDIVPCHNSITVYIGRNKNPKPNPFEPYIGFKLLCIARGHRPSKHG